MYGIGTIICSQHGGTDFFRKLGILEIEMDVWRMYILNIFFVNGFSLDE